MLKKVVSGSLLVCGTTVGAGMLGIPLLTAQAGFWPAVGITIFAWAILLWTGLLFLEATLWMKEGSNLLSMSSKLLGKKARLFSGAMFLFLYYCLLVAYFAAGAPMIWFLPSPWNYLVFGLIFGGIVGLGAKWIDRSNLVLIAGLVLTYILMIGFGASKVDSGNFLYGNSTKAFFALPILFSAFGYHNIIPSLVTYFGNHKQAVRQSIIFGTTLALVIYLIWQWLVLGIIPASEIKQALSEGRPVTAALENMTGHRQLFLIGQLFAFFALVTSLLGVAFSMVDFLGDGLKWKRDGLQRGLLTCGTFIPPLILALLYPKIFDDALGIAGGIGEAILNGWIPIALVWAGTYRLGYKTQMRINRFQLSILALVIGAVVALEIYLLTN